MEYEVEPTSLAQAEALAQELPPLAPAKCRRFKRAPYTFSSRFGRRGRYTTWEYRRVMAAVAEYPGSSPARISELAETSRSATYSNLKRLREEGMIEKGSLGWVSTPRGISILLTWSAQLRLSGFHNEPSTVTKDPVGGHSEIKTRGLGLQLEQCERADRKMANWGVWPEIRKTIRTRQSPAAQLAAIAKVEKRAGKVNHKAKYLTALMLRPRPMGVRAVLDWTLAKAPGLSQAVQDALEVRLGEMETLNEKWHLAHAVRKAAASMARRARTLDGGDVTGIQGWVRKAHRSRELSRGLQRIRVAV